MDYFGAIKVRIQERRRYGDLRSWLLSLYRPMVKRIKWLPLPKRGMRWRIHLAEMAHPILVRDGTSDWLVMRELFFDSRPYDVVSTLKLGDAPAILDLGANCGLSVRLWQHYYPNARIFAVEPDPENFVICQENVAKGPNPEHVSLHQACVASQPGTLFIDKSAPAWSIRSHYASGVDKIAVRAMTVPEVIADDGLTVNLVKCDIEGGEQDLFRVCDSWICRVEFLIIEVHLPYTLEQLHDDLVRNGAKIASSQVLERAGNHTIALIRLNGRRVLDK